MWHFINGSALVLCVFWTLLVANIELVDSNLVPPPAQPCDRTRRVFTDAYGEISDGPTGFNYTQVSYLDEQIIVLLQNEYVIASDTKTHTKN